MKSKLNSTSFKVS